MGRKATGGITEFAGKVRLNFRYQDARWRPLLDLEWNERNRKSAERMLGEIEKKIARGDFDPAAYFPDYARKRAVKAGRPVHASAQQHTFGIYAARWLRGGTWAAATRSDYDGYLRRIWLPKLANRDIRDILYSELLEIIGDCGLDGKTRNNNLIAVRGAFDLARKDRIIPDNPAAAIENTRTQARPCDPLTLDEVEAVLACATEREHPQIANYYTAAFFAGFRPSEQIALDWADVDFNRRTVRVHQAIVRGKPKDSTKTYQPRDVELTDRAWAAFEAQRSHTQLASGKVFWNPATGAPWADLGCQAAYWARTLKRCGIRYRVPYQARHTFATLCLMRGANPTWISRQMGHTNAQMLFNVYAKWIDGADQGRERDKMNAALGAERAKVGPKVFSEK